MYLELLQSFNADAFMNSLKHLIARRGLPAKLFSDHGTNIVCSRKKVENCISTSRRISPQRYQVKIEPFSCVSYGWFMGDIDTYCSEYLVWCSYSQCPIYRRYLKYIVL